VSHPFILSHFKSVAAVISKASEQTVWFTLLTGVSKKKVYVRDFILKIQWENFTIFISELTP
jgi:hypothetical protein